MSKSVRRLGRGLDSLVSDLRSSVTRPADESKASAPRSVPERELVSSSGGKAVSATMLAIEKLKPNPFQPRDVTISSNVASLAQSMKQNGLLQPVIVRPKAEHHEIIAGERRWHAAKSLGMSHIPAIVREATDEEMLELALIENIHREDLNAMERAKAYREFATRFSLGPEEVAARIGEDRTTVVNYLRLLELPEQVRALVAHGKLSMGHARCLLGIADDDHRMRLAESAAHNDLSVRALEEIVRREKTRRGPHKPAEVGARDLRAAHLHDLQQRFEEAVKTKVTIHQGKRKGTGRIVIQYYSLDDFDRIAGMLGVNAE